MPSYPGIVPSGLNWAFLVFCNLTARYSLLGNVTIFHRPLHPFRCFPARSMYTYAFLLNSDKPLDLPEGIWGSLELVGNQDVVALIEPDLPFKLSEPSDRQLMQAVLSHDRVIQDMFQQTAVLPLRFGTYFVSRQGLVDHLRSHQDEYLTKLIHLQGKAEYTLKLAPFPLPETTITADTNGNLFFRTRKQLSQNKVSWYQQQQLEIQSLSRAIKTHYPETVQGGAANDGIARLHLLSSQQEEALLHERLTLWQCQSHFWQLSLGEALPPYHFV